MTKQKKNLLESFKEIVDEHKGKSIEDLDQKSLIKIVHTSYFVIEKLLAELKNYEKQKTNLMKELVQIRCLIKQLENRETVDEDFKKYMELILCTFVSSISTILNGNYNAG
jgi:heme oxygenase